MPIARTLRGPAVTCRTDVPRYQGRLRRNGTGLVHQRPENRQRGGSPRPSAVAGRGQATSIAATMAATSSSDASPPRVTARSVLVGSLLDTGTYSGTLPCLRLGRSSRLERSMSSPATSLARVSAGSITSST